MKNRKGFTLIEILIVVAIIGILASVALVGLAPAQRRGRDSRRLSDLRQAQTALELYYSKCGYYPGQVQGGTTCGARTGAPSDWNALEDVITQSNLGIRSLPNDPSGGASYQYASTDGTGYTIAAVLEDKGNSILSQSAPAGSNGIADCTTNGKYCIEF